MVEAEDLGVLRDSTGSRTTAVHCPCTLLHGQKRDGALERILERSGIPLVETAEKAAEINILDVRAFGSFGRVYLGGEERDIMAGYGAAVAAIEGVSGRETAAGRRD